MHSHYITRIISYLIDLYLKTYFFWKLQKILVPYLITHNRYNPTITFLSIAIFTEILWFFLIPFMQSSFLQASFGAFLLRIRISDAQGERISFLRALYRNCILFFCPWGAITWFFTPEKQCLHDLLSDTIVLNYKQDYPFGFIYKRPFLSYKAPLKKIKYSIIFIRFLIIAFQMFVLFWLLLKNK